MISATGLLMLHPFAGPLSAVTAVPGTVTAVAFNARCCDLRSCATPEATNNISSTIAVTDLAIANLPASGVHSGQ
jgi:hypothetical protein